MTIIDLKCVTRSYAKASREDIDKVAAPFQADPQKMELLSILDEQVELLAKEGRRAEYGRKRVSWYLVLVLDTYTDATCSNNRNRYHKAAWILPSAESSKGSVTFSASARSVMTILLW